jgi:hypothetical protein
MRITYNNILNNKEGVIIHQINTKHAMGAGLALQIRNMYPKHYADYMRNPLYLGNLIVTTINSNFCIVGFIAQDSYGRNGTYTDYNAFEQCLKTLQMRLNTANYNPNIYFPYKIGCGLAGGNWDIISSLIETYFPNAIICKL